MPTVCLMAFLISPSASILNVAYRLMCVWPPRHIAIRYIVESRAFLCAITSIIAQLLTPRTIFTKILRTMVFITETFVCDITILNDIEKKTKKSPLRKFCLGYDKTNFYLVDYTKTVSKSGKKSKNIKYALGRVQSY